MSKHTAGPWEVHLGYDNTGYPCFYIHGMAGDQKRDIPVLTANAKLIEAAPELKAAAELAKAALAHAKSDCWATGPNTGDAIEDLVVCPGCRAINAIDAALAKATGAA